MDGPVFDAMLKTALEEALRRDIEETPAPPPPSRRQRRRMRRLLADPGRAWAPEAGAERRSRNPVRWLAVVVIAALLTGVAAAGFALGGGEYFRRTFAESSWAERYGTAADTEQLLDMGADIGGGQVEADGLRVEIMDAVFDGQMALFAIRVTVLDRDLLAQLQEENSGLMLGRATVFSADGNIFSTFGFSPLEEDGLEEGQYSAEFAVLGEGLSTAGLCRIQIEDLVRFPLGESLGEVLRKGPWTLSAALRPTEVLRLEPDRAFRAEGEDWVLENATLTPLAMRLTARRTGEPSQEAANWVLYGNLTFHMKNGEDFAPATYSRFTTNDDGNRQVDIRFHMPLDLTQIEYVRFFGEDIYLKE